MIWDPVCGSVLCFILSLKSHVCAVTATMGMCGHGKVRVPFFSVVTILVVWAGMLATWDLFRALQGVSPLYILWAILC